jgi:hypothetical protein
MTQLRLQQQYEIAFFEQQQDLFVLNSRSLFQHRHYPSASFFS